MILVERTFHLNAGNTEYFIKRLSDSYDDLQHDSAIQTFSVLQRENSENDVIVRFILTESASWEKRMEQAYVKAFLADTSAYVSSIDTDFQEVLKFYTTH